MRRARGYRVVTLYFDGACEPVNPGGIGTYGFVIRWEDYVQQGGGVAGSGRGMTNNVAEYTALGKGLRWLADNQGLEPPVFAPVLTTRDTLLIRGDSKLVVSQLAGAWRCNHEHLRKLRDRCLELLKILGCRWQTEWIPRDQNAEADALSVKAWVEHTGKAFPQRKRD